MKIARVLIIVFIFLAGVTTVILCSLYSHRNVETRTLTAADRQNTSGKYIQLSAGITHYQLDGPDSGKVVILVNGFSVPYYIWDTTSQYLAGKGYRVLRYDFYGRGYSDRLDTTYNQQLYTDQINELITKLHLKTPLSIGGVSFGGDVASVFTCKYPNIVDKLFLVDPVYVDFAPHQPQFLKTYDEAIHANDRLQSQAADFKHPEKHQDWIEKYRSQMVYKGFRQSLVSTYYNFHFKATETLPCINSQKKPVLLVWGKDDHTVFYNYSDSVRKQLNVTFVPVADAAHLPHIEKPQVANPAIGDFLGK